ncbi:polyisoprenyl-phosphate glycosyltransferase [Acidiphilium sp. MT5]
MRDIAQQDKQVVAINLSRNYGQQLAITAGLKICRGERAFLLDADLQDPPDLLPDMMARMDDGCDIVYGVRTERQCESLFKRTSATIFYKVLRRMVDIEIPADAGDFRLMSRRAVDILNSMPEHHRFIRGMVSWIGLRQEPLPYERAGRFAGRGHYPLSKMIRLSIDAITGFSTRPLRIAAYSGIAFSAATLLLLIYVLVRHFTGHTIRGWTSLAVIVLAIGSVQMLIVGVMGEYLGRLYIESKNRPLYIIQEIVSSSTINTSFPSFSSGAPREK